MSIWENIGNENKCLAGMGMEMGLKLTGMGKNWKAESHSHTPLNQRWAGFFSHWRYSYFLRASDDELID